MIDIRYFVLLWFVVVIVLFVSLFLSLFFVSCSPGWPLMSYIAKDDLELEILLPPLPQCTTMPGLPGTQGFMPARQAPHWPSHVSLPPPLVLSRDRSCYVA